MGRLLQSIDARPQGVVWLDSTDYAVRLLNGGAEPWLDVAACTAWQRKAQGLLGSDAISLPLGQIADAIVRGHPGLREIIAAKRRASAPLKALLADEGLTSQLLGLLNSYRASFATVPLVLAMPSPRRWLQIAYRQAFGGEAVDTDEDDVDAAAVHIAAFLRAFGDTGIDALLLEETDEASALSAGMLELYQPIYNVAAHYRWDMGLLAPVSGLRINSTSLDFLITADASSDAHTGVLVADAFWAGGMAPAARLRYARVPADMQPERVLERVASLR